MVLPALVFADGVRVGACLDRNGLRPLRVAVCDDGLVAVGSEAGSVSTRGHGRVRRLKIGPGQSISVDPGEGGVLDDAAVKSRLANRRPYGDWLLEHLVEADRGEPISEFGDDVLARQVAARLSEGRVHRGDPSDGGRGLRADLLDGRRHGPRPAR